MMIKLCNLEFPKGVRSIYIEGRRYTRETFIAAKKKIRSRDASGRFLKTADLEDWS